MGIRNQQAAEDARKVRSGKDAAIYDGEGLLLATIEEFKSTLDVKTSETQPIGSFGIVDVITGHKTTISFTQLVIKDDKFITDVFDMTKNGTIPEWHLQGSLEGLNGGEERVIYNNCIPSGSIDLQNFTSGDIVKRAWALTCNGGPKLQGRLNQ